MDDVLLCRKDVASFHLDGKIENKVLLLKNFVWKHDINFQMLLTTITKLSLRIESLKYSWDQQNWKFLVIISELAGELFT